MYTPFDYFEETVKFEKFEDLSNEKIDELIDKLLSVLPHEKHLFKYRKFDTSLFEKHLESYKEGYLYLPLASELNDKIDCSFNYKALRNENEVLSYILKNKYRVHFLNLLETGNKTLKINLKEKLIVLEALQERDDDLFAASCLKKINLPLVEKIRFVKKVRDEACQYVASESYLKETIEKYNKLGETMRNTTRVFSFCESCDQDSMWAYYCNENKGYCIEYDLNLIRNLDSSTKQKFLSFYKVIYDNNREPIDAFDLYDVGFMDVKNYKKRLSIEHKILKSFITKSKSWEHEKEWRLISMKKEEKLFVDIICAFVIDEDVLDNPKVKELIDLANERNWKIKIRHLSSQNNQFEYIEREPSNLKIH